MSLFPEYLKVAAADLGRGTPVKVRVLGDMASIGRDVAEAMRQELLCARARAMAQHSSSPSARWSNFRCSRR